MRKAIVFTALGIETKAMLAQMDDVKPPRLVHGIAYVPGRLPVGGDDGWEVLVAELGPGNVEAATHISKAEVTLTPEVIIFAGIAGSLKDLAIGDVVAASEVAWSERARVSEGERQARPQIQRCALELVSAARYTANTEAWKARGDALPTRLRAIVGQVLSGEELIKDAGYKKELRRLFSDALAVENEGYGTARAVGASTRVIVVRAASDNADETKDDKDQGLAAASAAAFTAQLLINYWELLAEEADGSAASRSDSAELRDTDPGSADDRAGRTLDALMYDLDLLADEESDIRNAATTDASHLGRETILALLGGLGREINDSSTTLVGRRLCVYGRALAAAAWSALEMSNDDVERFLTNHPHGGGVILAQPDIFSGLDTRSRRRVLSSLLGYEAQPRNPSEIGWGYLLDLHRRGLLAARETARIEAAMRAVSYPDLGAAGVSLGEMSARLLSDLSSGEFARQNPAARFVARSSPDELNMQISPSEDAQLGAHLIAAAIDDANGAREATTFSQLSKWSSARLGGGIAGCLSRARNYVNLPGPQLRSVLRAAVATGTLPEALHAAKEVLSTSVTDGSRKSLLRDIAEEIVDAASDLDAASTAAVGQFAEWLIESMPRRDH